MKKIGKQIGCIVYGKGVNARAYANEAQSRGLIVVWCAKYAGIYTAR